ncbi:hypothetical protein D3C85_1381180 [compost metagenome]
MGKGDFVKGGFKLVQRFQAFPQKHHHEISLLADNGVDCSASFLGFLYRTPFLHKGMQLFQGNSAFFIIGRRPGRPVQRTEVMQGIPALQCQRGFVHVFSLLSIGIYVQSV